MRDHLFSYGLFKKGQPLHTWLFKHCEPRLVGPAVMLHATLLDLGESFPALKDQGKNAVHGELYSIPWETLLEINSLISRDKTRLFQMQRHAFLVGSPDPVTMDAYTFIFKGFGDKPRAVKVIKDGIWR